MQRVFSAIYALSGWRLLVFAFLSHKILVWIGAVNAGIDFWDVQSYIRGDATHYLSIAERGYYVEACIDPASPYALCGNNSWLPFFSALIWLMSVGTSLPIPVVGLILTHFLFFALLAAICFAPSSLILPQEKYWAVMLTAFFPGSIYFDAIFPMSLLDLLEILTIIFLAQQRRFTVALLIPMLVLTYSIGWVFVAGLWLALLLNDLRRNIKWSQLLLRWYHLLPVLVIPSFLLFFYLCDQHTGMWDSYLRGQANSRYYDAFPAQGYLKSLWEGLSIWRWNYHSADGINTAVVFVLVLLMGVKAWRVRVTLQDYELMALVSSLALWLFPITLNSYYAFYRTNVALVPLVFCLRLLSAKQKKIFVICCALLLPFLSRLFFRGTIT